MSPPTTSRFPDPARRPSCRAPGPPHASESARSAEPARADEPSAADAGRERRSRVGEFLPQHWTSADANGARRWGLSFGTSLLLTIIVGAFAAYMTMTERVDRDAGDRPTAVGRSGLTLDRAGDAVSTDPTTTTRTPLSSALVPLLREQIATAHADGEADAVRLRRERAARRQTRAAHPVASAPRMKAAPNAVRPISPASAPSISSAPAVPEPAPKPDAARTAMPTSDPMPADRDATPQPDPSADKSFSGQIERPAPPAQSDPQPPDTPPPTTQPDALRPTEPPSVSRQAPSAGVRHARGHPVARSTASRRRHPPRTALAHAPAIVFTLPRFLTAPLIRMPEFPHAPSRAFDLSDNQRALYRGH